MRHQLENRCTAPGVTKAGGVGTEAKMKQEESGQLPGLQTETATSHKAQATGG